MIFFETRCSHDEQAARCPYRFQRLSETAASKVTFAFIRGSSSISALVRYPNFHAYGFSLPDGRSEFPTSHSGPSFITGTDGRQKACACNNEAILPGEKGA